MLLLLSGDHLRQAVAGISAEPVLRVEEDWQLMLNEPGQEINAPQFHVVMSPYAHVDGAYALVSWNYRELPDFTAGGLQIQGWEGEYDLGYKNLREDTLSRDAETIQWTQRLETTGSKVTFKVLNGQSQSWGCFGGEYAHIDLPVAVPNLNAYSPQVSRENSWITYGSNRVTSLMITQVRRYGADGLLSVDSTPIVVFQLGGDE